MKPIFRPIAWMTRTGSAGAGAGVLLVGLADVLGIVPGDGAVAGRVVEERELGVAEVVVDGLGHADGDEVEPCSWASLLTLWAVSCESLPPM